MNDMFLIANLIWLYVHNYFDILWRSSYDIIKGYFENYIFAKLAYFQSESAWNCITYQITWTKFKPFILVAFIWRHIFILKDESCLSNTTCIYLFIVHEDINFVAFFLHHISHITHVCVTQYLFWLFDYRYEQVKFQII